MFSFEDDAMLVQDREDLIAILRMRFGQVPPGVIHLIYRINQLDELQRLILAAANVPSWELFIKELQENEGAFRVAGEQFNPLMKVKGWDD